MGLSEPEALPRAGLHRHPVIKWSGSKRPIARRLHELWPAGGSRYVEPFVGGGSMLPGRPARAAVAGDILGELIGLWTAIRDDPAGVLQHYRAHWEDRQARGEVVYTEVRDRFNAERDPRDLMFLSRMCVNGLIRFNQQGQFNNSLHHTRPGIHPDRFGPVVGGWSKAVSTVRFVHQDFRETLEDAAPGDRVFLDPPYRGTRGRYLQGTFAPDDLAGALEELNRRGVHWMLTWDGQAGDRSYPCGIPPELYASRLALPTGHSPFTRLMGTSLDTVQESVLTSFAL